MNTLKTTARVDDDDLGHLTLVQPLPERPVGEVEVIVHFKTDEQPVRKRVNWQDAIGSFYRDFPDATRKTTAEWMDELRGGEYAD